MTITAVQMCYGSTCGKVPKGELYAHIIQKLIYLLLITEVLCKDVTLFIRTSTDYI